MFISPIYTPTHKAVNTHKHTFKDYYAFMYKSSYYEIALNAAKANAAYLIKNNDELNVSQLAKISGITQPTLKRIFDGEIQQPKADTLKKLGKALKINWGKLLDTNQPIISTPAEQAEELAKSLAHKATPKSLEVLRRIEKSALDGLLTEEDIILLDTIASRLTNDKPAGKD